MFLKHLNPLNNIRAAQGVEIVTNFIKTDSNYCRKTITKWLEASKNCVKS